MGLIPCLDNQTHDQGQEGTAPGADTHPHPVKLPHVTSANERHDPPHKATRRQRRIQAACAVALREDAPTVPRGPPADNPMDDRTRWRHSKHHVPKPHVHLRDSGEAHSITVLQHGSHAAPAHGDFDGSPVRGHMADQRCQEIGSEVTRGGNRRRHACHGFFSVDRPNGFCEARISEVEDSVKNTRGACAGSNPSEDARLGAVTK